jgi:hypothetical protein
MTKGKPAKQDKRPILRLRSRIIVPNNDPVFAKGSVQVNRLEIFTSPTTSLSRRLDRLDDFVDDARIGELGGLLLVCLEYGYEMERCLQWMCHQVDLLPLQESFGEFVS